LDVGMLWRVDYEKPMRTGHKQGEMQLFSLRLSINQDWHIPGHRRGKCRTAACKLFRFREAGMQVSPVIMSHPKNRCSTLFTTGYKRFTEGGHQAFGLRLLVFALGLFALGFLMWEAFGRERTSEGKILLKRIG
jgi:hypothetical protein